MSENDWKFFSSKLEQVNLNKRTILVKKGEVENYLSFISNGIARVFIPKEENDITFGFLFDNDFMSAYDSFLTRLPSEYACETLTNTTLWRINYDDLQEVYEKTACGNLIGRKMNEVIYLIKSKRELAFLNKTAEERYMDLFKDRPELFELIPLKYVASYIGVTPQALSRIRKRIT